jgi:hypothetical protein
MQRPENVSKCADCAAQFSILKHKHNCRTCGAVSSYAKIKGNIKRIDGDVVIKGTVSRDGFG